MIKKFYEPFNIDLEIYQDDLKNNVKIASLQAGIGEWIYVPCSFISEAQVLTVLNMFLCY